jgi:hypothetical protein
MIDRGESGRSVPDQLGEPSAPVIVCRWLQLSNSPDLAPRIFGGVPNSSAGRVLRYVIAIRLLTAVATYELTSAGAGGVGVPCPAATDTEVNARMPTV